MFSAKRQKIVLAVYVFLILFIPVGAYIASEQESKSLKTSAKDRTITKEVAKSTLSPVELLKQESQNQVKDLLDDDSLESTPSSLPSSAVSFGPTLNLKLILEGRPTNKQVGKVFVGIASGSPTTSPKYILSFTIDLPNDGIFNGLSLAGLTENSQYTAYLKGSAQIATSSAFTLSPSVTSLNAGGALTMLTGDLNEDNTINAADYSIAKAAFGATPTHLKWNANIDLNKDDIVNNLDLSLVTKNFGKVGAGGVWTSPPPSIATSSASYSEGASSAYGGLATPSATPTGGYWLWVPSF